MQPAKGYVHLFSLWLFRPSSVSYTHLDVYKRQGGPELNMEDPNGWTVRTKDGSDSAQWEVQLVVTEDGYELISW